MESEEQEAAGARELSERFQDILGQLPPEEVADLVLRIPIGLYSIESGFKTFRTFSGALPPIKSCERDSTLHTFGGLITTGPDGKAEFRLSDFHCSASFIPGRPIISVATAHTRSPVFVTMVNTFVGTTTPDLKMEVFAWNPDGTPAGGVPVRWLCRLVDFSGGVE